MAFFKFFHLGELLAPSAKAYDLAYHLNVADLLYHLNVADLSANHTISDSPADQGIQDGPHSIEVSLWS